MTENKRTLQASYFEAFLNSFVVGLAENFFTAFSLKMGVSSLQTGLLISLPLLFAAAGQFVSLQTYSLSKTKNISDFVLKATLVQSVCLILLSAWSLSELKSSNTMVFAGLMFLFSIYWYGHFVIQPAWNRWISEFVPVVVSQQFFSVRTWLNQLGIITGLLVGGFGLHLNYLQVPIHYLFAFLFLISFACKIGAYYFFNLHKKTEAILHISLASLIKVYKKHFSFYKSYALFNFSIYFSAPFVAGYLLNEKNLRYLEFTVVMIGLFLGKIITSLLLKSRKDQIDPTKLMFYGGLIAAPLPALWPFAESAHLMFITHFLSGMAWASWEVGLSLCIFKNISAEEKAETVSAYNYLAVATQVCGTLAGALIIKFVFSSNYVYLFYFAGLARLITVLPLKRNKLSAETPTNLHQTA